SEILFLQSMQDENMERALVTLEYLNRNNGKLTREQLENAGYTYEKDLFGSSMDYIEMAYEMAQNGFNLAQAELIYQQEIVDPQRYAAIGAIGIKALSGGRSALVSSRSVAANNVKV